MSFNKIFIAGAAVSLMDLLDRISDHRRLVRLRAFAAEVPGLNILLGVVPCPAGIGQVQSQRYTRDQRPGQHLSEASPRPG